MSAVISHTQLIWYTIRATGTVALVLLTATVVLGILTATRSATGRWPRFAISDLHRRVSLIAMVFVGLHVLTIMVDSFVPITWISVLVPFTSPWRSFWVRLGTAAFDLLVAVLLTSLLRQRVPVRAWRSVHWLVYASWPLAVVHGLGAGTDRGFAWMLALVATCMASVAGALVYRIRARPHRAGLRTTAPSREVALSTLRVAEPTRRAVDSPTGARR